MRTTVSIDDEILGAAKDEARRRGITLGQLLEEAARLLLHSLPDRPPGPAIPVYDGGGSFAPGVDPTSNRSMREAAEAGGPADRLR